VLLACPEKPVQVFASGSSSAFLAENGTVYAWGCNKFGRLGLGSELDHFPPTPLENLPPMASLALGFFHNLFLSQSGSVYVSGSNCDGQLGLGEELDHSSIPIKLNLEVCQ
jgi:alpha-tubulin suppressor-like RCC1 family protein